MQAACSAFKRHGSAILPKGGKSLSKTPTNKNVSRSVYVCFTNDFAPTPALPRGAKPNKENVHRMYVPNLPQSPVVKYLRTLPLYSLD